MDDFLKELPALIITLAVLAMATILIIIAHVNVSDALAIVSPAVAFWFMGGAFKWQPTTPNTARTQPMRIPPPPPGASNPPG